MPSAIIHEMKTADLKPHPANATIYGDETLPADFLESIKTLGVIEPLLVRTDGTIISGHRRWLAAKKAGLATVPTRTGDFADELEEIEMLISSNKQREKSPSQIAREGSELQRIESERARKRMEAGKKVDPSANWQQGRTDDHVAAELGMSTRTWQRLKTIFERAKSGDVEAAELMKALDAGDISVHKAYKTLKGQVDTLETLKRGHKEHDEGMNAELESLRLENSRIAAAMEEAKKPQAPVALPEPKVERVEVEVIKEVVPPPIQAKLREQENLICELQRREVGNPKLEEKRDALLREIQQLREQTNQARSEKGLLEAKEFLRTAVFLKDKIVEMAENNVLTIDQLEESEAIFKGMIVAGNNGIQAIRDIRGEVKSGGGLRAL